MVEDRAGRTYRLNEKASDSGRGMVVPGVEYRVEGLWKELTGTSWMFSDGNPAAMQYALRSEFGPGLPLDDDVWYGKIGTLGHLVHESEIGEEVTDDGE